MGSRRRPNIRSAPEDDLTGTSSSTENDNVPQLLPTIEKNETAEKLNIEDYLGHQKWHYKRKAAIHPASTNFGPESLRQFLQGEITKMENLASSVRNMQEREFRNLARSLVNASTGIYSVEEDGNTVLRIKTSPDQALSPPEDLVSDTDKSFGNKGKKSALQIPQSDGMDDAPQRPVLPSPLLTTHPQTAKSITFLRRSLQSKYDDNGAGDGKGIAKPVRLQRPRRSSIDLPLQDSDSKKYTTRNSKCSSIGEGSTKTSMFQSCALDGIPSINDELVPRSKMVAQPEVLAMPQSTTQSQQSINGAKLILSRASSFEHHASYSRDFMRSNAKLRANRGDHSLDERGRRRKMPSTSEASLSMQASSLPGCGDYSSKFTNASLGNSHDLISPPYQKNFREQFGNSKSLSKRRSSDPLTLDPASSKFDLDHAESSRGGWQIEQPLSDDEDMLMVDEEISTDLVEQQAILESIEAQNKLTKSGVSQNQVQSLSCYNYSQIVPEDMPFDIRQAEINRCTIWRAHGFDGLGKLIATKQHEQSGLFSVEQLDPLQQNILGAPNESGDYPRIYVKPSTSKSADLQHCPPPTVPISRLPAVIWTADTGNALGGVLQYLSSVEVKTLRLVCKSLAEDLAPHLFRNVVTKFNPFLFDLHPTYSVDGKIVMNANHSMLHNYGPEMNKFGISFEFDAHGLMHAPFKVTETTVNAWFGKYVWPVKDYPYFSPLRDIDKLLDDERRLLTQAMRNLTNCSELAISVDSGHGWLEGPDMSDLALYRSHDIHGSKVFGKTFSAPDLCSDNNMKEFFRWAQINSINENIKYLDGKSRNSRQELEMLRSIVIRDYDSYCSEKHQPDYIQSLHTGGDAGSSTFQVQNSGPTNSNVVPASSHGTPNSIPPLPVSGPASNAQPLLAQNRRQLFNQVMKLVRSTQGGSNDGKEKLRKKRNTMQPQWPVILNGFNLAAESRGDSNWVQSRVAIPSNFPLLPNCLTEAQAQWMMETSWIQRTFLSAYIDAVRVNSAVLCNVHTLHISKLSSGLLPSLSHRSFWVALKGLRKVTVLVKPDWRLEHTPGDKFFQSNMTTEPVNAACKFTELLQDHIAPLENLNSLHIGYSGGGEHQVGIFGRNQHILPVPVTQNPREWFIAQHPANPRPKSSTILTFPHIRTLTFENCWFSPLLLEQFMIKSRDTSLHNLILDSVSLTAQSSSNRADGPLRTIDNQLKCEHSSLSWIYETVPTSAAWFNVLDKITPGQTLLDHKYDAGMINVKENPRPEKVFRGNIEQISLKSCGYVKVLGISSNDFNQNELVFQNAQWVAMDDGLKTHASRFTKTIHHDIVPDCDEDDTDGQQLRRSNTTGPSVGRGRGFHLGAMLPRSQRQQPKDTRPKVTNRFIMLSGRPAHVRGESIQASDEVSQVSALTGYLTQCIHPVEKRLLEQMWGIRFGWGDDMKRWEAVEDGWFMGGTGRFSGEIFKDSSLQDATIAAAEDKDRRDVAEEESHHHDQDDGRGSDSTSST